MIPWANGFPEHIGLSTRECRGSPQFFSPNEAFFGWGQVSSRLHIYLYRQPWGLGIAVPHAQPQLPLYRGEGISQRGEDFASARHFFGVSSPDFESYIGLYVSETDPIGTIFVPRMPIAKTRPASPKAQLGWAAVGHFPSGVRISRFRLQPCPAALGSCGGTSPKG